MLSNLLALLFLLKLMILNLSNYRKLKHAGISKPEIYLDRVIIFAVCLAKAGKTRQCQNLSKKKQNLGGATVTLRLPMATSMHDR